MNYKIHSFRHGEIILNNEPDYKIVWNELLNAITSITDDEIINHHENNPRKAKSISESINNILKTKLVELDWCQVSLRCTILKAISLNTSGKILNISGFV